MEKQLVFVCVGNNFSWGKGKTQLEAMRNARIGFKHEFAMTLIYTSKPEDVGVNGMGGVCHSNGDLVFETSVECLWQVFEEDTWEDFVNTRILEFAANELMNRSQDSDGQDPHYKLYQRLDDYISKVVYKYD